jgi:hypothetical protein
VLLAFGSFAVVEDLRLGAAERRKRGEEHGVLEPVVASPRLGGGVEGGAGLAVHGGEPGVGGEFGAVGEAGAVTDLGEDPGAGPRPDPGEADQQTAERVSEEDLLDLSGQRVAPLVEAVQFDCELGDDPTDRLLGGQRDGLRLECGSDSRSDLVGESRRPGLDRCGDLAPCHRFLHRFGFEPGPWR